MRTTSREVFTGMCAKKGEGSRKENWNRDSRGKAGLQPLREHSDVRAVNQNKTVSVGISLHHIALAERNTQQNHFQMCYLIADSKVPKEQITMNFNHLTNYTLSSMAYKENILYIA